MTSCLGVSCLGGSPDPLPCPQADIDTRNTATTGKYKNRRYITCSLKTLINSGLQLRAPIFQLFCWNIKLQITKSRRDNVCLKGPRFALESLRHYHPASQG